MKKILLATSALVMVAGAASAEIALSGSARMGLVYADTATGSTTQFSSRVRIVFTASGETDTGLAFGASMRADQSGQGGTANGDSTVFISGAFGKLTMGDVGGAADALVGQVSGVGYGPNDSLQEIGFVGTTKTAAYYEYSAGALTFGLGAGQIESAGSELNVAVKYATDAYSVALGYETTDGNPAVTPLTLDTVAAEDLISLGGSATFGAATVKARVSDSDIAGRDTTWALSVDYAVGATTLTAFYTDFGNTLFDAAGTDAFASTDTQHIGIGAAYDLGGGATVAGGIVRQNNNVGVNNTFADVGLKFSF
ncbi:porin [Tabrizicola sp.]|uniref:porin n=1 Tax=Tabrizicola sp. TaxID=2005166 RepID=UPI0025CFA9C0|nr:porin [Tabrizicola sp.]